MNKLHKFLFYILLFLSLNLNAQALSVNDHRIAVLVNDKLITSYDIVQRMKMNAILSGIEITPANNGQLQNTVVQELIKEKLKNEKLNEYNITVSDNEYLQHEEVFYKSTSLNKSRLKEIFEINNIKYSEFQSYLIEEISWQKLISGMYYRLTSTSEIEVEEIILNNPDIGKEKARDIIIQKQLDLKSSKMIRDMLNEATIEYK